MRKDHGSSFQSPSQTPVKLACVQHHEAGVLGGSTDDDSGDGNEDGCSCYTHELAIPTPEDAPVKPAISAAARLVRGAALVLLVALAAVLGLSLARSTTQGGPWVPAAVADQEFAGQRLKTLPLRMRGAGRRLAVPVPVPVPQRGLQGLPPVVDEDRPDASGVADATGKPSRPSRPQQQQQPGYNPTSPETVGVPLPPPHVSGPSYQAPGTPVGPAGASPGVGMGGLTNQMGSLSLAKEQEQHLPSDAVKVTGGEAEEGGKGQALRARRA